MNSTQQLYKIVTVPYFILTNNEKNSIRVLYLIRVNTYSNSGVIVCSPLKGFRYETK